MKYVVCPYAFLLPALAGCAAPPPQASEGPEAAAAVLQTPASFTGDLPCADCTGLRTTLNLLPDGTFIMRETYLGARDGREHSVYDLGRWEFVQGTATLSLRGGKASPRRFTLRDGTTLRQLDGEGGEIQSSLNYELRRSAQLEPLREAFRLSGLYTYMADAASLQECLTGKRFPVASTAGALALERAYLAAQSAAGTPVLVTLEGHFETRAGMEGGSEEHVVVDRFERAWPGETCANRNPSLPLVGTRWVLTELSGSAPRRVAGEQPWL